MILCQSNSDLSISYTNVLTYDICNRLWYICQFSIRFPVLSMSYLRTAYVFDHLFYDRLVPFHRHRRNTPYLIHHWWHSSCFGVDVHHTSIYTSVSVSPFLQVWVLLDWLFLYLVWPAFFVTKVSDTPSVFPCLCKAIVLFSMFII
jgi:hypothetical protein